MSDHRSAQRAIALIAARPPHDATGHTWHHSDPCRRPVQAAQPRPAPLGRALFCASLTQ